MIILGLNFWLYLIFMVIFLGIQLQNDYSYYLLPQVELLHVCVRGRELFPNMNPIIMKYSHHGGQADVGQAAYQCLTEAGQLQEQGLVLLLDLLILLLHALQVLLHGRDLKQRRTQDMAD